MIEITREQSQDDKKGDCFDSYYACVTSCYGLSGEDVECVTKCVATHIKVEPELIPSSSLE